MKYLKQILIIFLLLPFALSAQVDKTIIECVLCEWDSKSDCPTCPATKAKAELRSGILVKKGVREYFIEHPFKEVTRKNNIVTIKDFKGHSVDISVAETSYFNVAQLMEAVADCSIGCALANSGAGGGTDDQDLSFLGTILSIEDGNSVDLSSLINDSDSDPTNELQTMSYNPTTGALTLSTNNSTVTIPLPDGSETILQQGTNVTVTGTGTTIDPYIINSTATAANDLDSIVNLSLVGNTLNAQNVAGNTVSVDLSSLVGTDDQNITSFTLSGANILSITIEDGNTQTVDLSGLVSDGTETIVDGDNDINVTGDGSPGNPYIVDFTETNTSLTIAGNTLTYTDEEGTLNNIALPLPDGSETSVTGGGDINVTGTGTTGDPYIVSFSETNTSLSIAGNVLTYTDENGTANNITLPEPDGSETVINQGANVTITGTGTTLDPYIISAVLTGAGSDLDSLTSLTLAGTILTAQNVAGATTNVDLAALVGTDDQNITSMSIDGANVLSVTIEDGNTQTVDLSNLAANVITSVDASVTVTATANGYDLSVNDDDTDPNNEIQTLSIAGQNLTISSGNTVVLPSADGSETVINGGGDIVVSGTGTTGDPYVVTFTETTTSLSLAGSVLSYTDEDGTVTNLTLPSETLTTLTIAGNALTYTDEGGTANVINLPVADGTETIVNGANDISVTGDGSTGNPYVVDFTEAVTTLTIAGNTLTYTDENGTGNNVVLPTPDGSETVVNGANDINVTGTGTTGDPYVIDFTETNTTLTIAGSVLTYTDENGTANNITLPSADGTETIVTGGGDIAVTGDGSSGTPYVVTFNETNTSLTLAGSVLTYTDENGSANNITLPSADGTETIVNGTNDISVTGDGSSGNPYVVDFTETNTSLTIAGNTLTYNDENGNANNVTLPTPDGTETIVTGGGDISVTGNGSAGTPYVVSFSETNTSLTLAGNVLTYTDENGTGNNVTLPSETVTSLTIAGSTLTYTDENGTANAVALPLPDGSETSVTGTNNISVTGTGTTGDPYVVDFTETNTSLTIAGNVLTYTDEAGTANNVTLPAETVTSLTLAGDVLTYTDEDGTANNITIPHVQGYDVVAPANATNINYAALFLANEENSGVQFDLFGASQIATVLMPTTGIDEGQRAYVRHGNTTGTVTVNTPSITVPTGGSVTLVYGDDGAWHEADRYDPNPVASLDGAYYIKSVVLDLSGSGTGSYVAIPLDSEIQDNGNIYSLDGNGDIVIPETGLYAITYNVAFDLNTNTETTMMHHLEKNGGTEVDGSRTYTFHRSLTHDEGAASRTLMATFFAGNTVGIESQILSGSDNLETINKEISISIIKL